MPDFLPLLPWLCFLTSSSTNSFNNSVIESPRRSAAFFSAALFFLEIQKLKSDFSGSRELGKTIRLYHVVSGWEGEVFSKQLSAYWWNHSQGFFSHSLSGLIIFSLILVSISLSRSMLFLIILQTNSLVIGSLFSSMVFRVSLSCGV